MGDSRLGQWLGVEGRYEHFCREERNFAAVLYHLLMDTKRLRRFLDLIEVEPSADITDVAVYFEYAHLRDLWATATRKGDPEERNRRCRDAIIAMLGFPEVELPLDCHRFNEFFIGPKAAASRKHIRIPSHWNDRLYDTWVERAGKGDRGEAFATRACRLKWAFNAKPDLVLHLGGNRAVCIEAKLESGTSTYKVKGRPAGARPCSMGQLDLQKFILQDLLGYDTTFVVVSKKGGGRIDDSGWLYHRWHDVIAGLGAIAPDAASESRMVEAFTTALEPVRSS